MRGYVLESDSRSPNQADDSPSPLNGERAGVRGEAVRCMSRGSSRPGAARRFGRGGGDRFSGWVAETEQDPLGFVGCILCQFGQSLAERAHPKILLPVRALDAIEKRAQINQFRPRFHEIKVNQLLP